MAQPPKPTDDADTLDLAAEWRRANPGSEKPPWIRSAAGPPLHRPTNPPNDLPREPWGSRNPNLDAADAASLREAFAGHRSHSTGDYWHTLVNRFAREEYDTARGMASSHAWELRAASARLLKSHEVLFLLSDPDIRVREAAVARCLKSDAMAAFLTSLSISPWTLKVSRSLEGSPSPRSIPAGSRPADRLAAAWGSLRAFLSARVFRHLRRDEGAQAKTPEHPSCREVEID